MPVEVGSIIEGTVTGITSFGAFVLLPGGVTGLVHISEVAEVYVRDINDFLKINDRVKVKVISVQENGKVGLSIRQASATARPSGTPQAGRGHNYRPRGQQTQVSFEDKLARFLKESEERQQGLKLYSDSRRGGRGGGRRG
ncbi:MAG: S1 RNA-binding domain-containing protein [Desulfurispora sp.]|uniref:S1 RNA-binding domain-containing protein n=1 Tax=Desulfurispora sp. TaxID=3014275 RepID=UPI004049CAB1